MIACRYILFTYIPPHNRGGASATVDASLSTIQVLFASSSPQGYAHATAPAFGYRAQMTYANQLLAVCGSRWSRRMGLK